MTHWRFEDAEIGAIHKAGRYLVSKEEIIQFAKQYDPLPFHVDEGAAAHSIFGGLIAWVLAVASTFVNYDYQMLFGAAAILISYIIPAHLLRIKKEKAEVNV